MLSRIKYTNNKNSNRPGVSQNLVLSVVARGISLYLDTWLGVMEKSTQDTFFSGALLSETMSSLGKSKIIAFQTHLKQMNGTFWDMDQLIWFEPLPRGQNVQRL